MIKDILQKQIEVQKLEAEVRIRKEHLDALKFQAVVDNVISISPFSDYGVHQETRIRYIKAELTLSENGRATPDVSTYQHDIALHHVDGNTFISIPLQKESVDSLGDIFGISANEISSFLG